MVVVVVVVVVVVAVVDREDNDNTGKDGLSVSGDDEDNGDIGWKDVARAIHCWKIVLIDWEDCPKDDDPNAEDDGDDDDGGNK